ncbi:MAG: glutaredoxin family protein [Pseudomonadota bacterium]
MAKMTKIEGSNARHHVAVYALSTCGWCRKMKKLLEALDIAYEFVDVDQLTGEDKEQAVKEVRQYNVRGTFPTVVVDRGEAVIAGFREDEVREALGA